MNWQYLKYFEIVAEEEHFTRAAQRLYITTSALSRAIASLEDELHVALFQKNGRNVRLTNYGELFLNYVKHATQTIDDGIKELEKVSNAAHGLLRIASIPVFAAQTCSDLVKEFYQLHPTVQISILNAYSKQVAQFVLSDQVDFGFVSDYFDPEEYASLVFMKVMEEEVVLIVPPDHPWSGREFMTLDEIANEKFISFDGTSGILPHYERVFAQAGYVYQPSMMLSDDWSIASMVRKGMGIALIPIGFDAISKNNLSVIHLKGDISKRNIYMIWKKGSFQSFAAEEFQSFVERRQALPPEQDKH